jgi:hypothetical protein
MFEIERQAMLNAFVINFESGAISKGDGRFQPGDVYKLQVKVSDQENNESCSTSTVTIFCGLRNGVNCEYWPGAQTPDIKSVSSARSPAMPPARKDKRIAIDKAVVEKGPFLCKVSGWIIPPEDNEYTFWLTSGGPAQLALANGPKPANTLKICECLYAHKAGDYDSERNQQSGEVRLKAGVCYYFELTFKSEGSNSHVGIAWKVPGKLRETVPAEFITPELP